MNHLIPQWIAEQYAAGTYHGHFPAVSLFLDVSGFSAVTTQLMQHGSEAAEVMAEVMQRLFEPLVDAVSAQDGFITTFAGDAFTALFRPHQDHLTPETYQHALAAALAIQQHLAAHPKQETPYGIFPFSVKVGLGDGDVEWGILIPPHQEGQATYYFRGSAVDTAAEAEHHADTGDVILSPHVFAAVHEMVTTRPVAQSEYVQMLTVTEMLPEPRALPDPAALPEQAAFVPPVILEREHPGEFRPVVSVFMNLLGIRGHEGLAVFMEAVFHLQQEYGGYLNKLDFGDKGCTLLLFWGMPTGTEHDIARAFNFILELADHTPGTYKAGITYRRIYTGMAGSTRRGEYTAYGDGPNLAARQMVAAPWGSIWLDEPVASRVAMQYDIEFAGEHPFKGFDTPQSVFALLERQEPDMTTYYQGELVGREAELAQLYIFIQPLFAGAGERRFAGILSVEGEAGLGKSRLVTEFLQRMTAQIATPDPLTRVDSLSLLPERERQFPSWEEQGVGKTGSDKHDVPEPTPDPSQEGNLAALPQENLPVNVSPPSQEGNNRSESSGGEFPSQEGSGVGKAADTPIQWFLCQTDQTVRQPFNPFRYWLWDYFGQSATQSASRNKRVFSRTLDHLLASVANEELHQDLTRGRSFLGALIGLEWENSLYTQLDPHGRYENTLSALKALILAESLRQPVILILEDVHWLDANSIAFLTRLVRQADRYPVAILATTRPQGGKKSLFGTAPYQRLELGAMSSAEMQQLATGLLNGPVGDDLVALLAERAEGNPFFAEQILLYLQEIESIVVDDGTWRLTRRQETSLLPDDVRVIFIARLDRLTEEVKAVVQTAAILGREFAVQVLGQILHDDTTLFEKLKAAEEEAIWTAIGQMRYIFRHVLLRDAAYDMQLRTRRRDLHRQAAETLEALSQTDGTAYVNEIAYHYEAAYHQGIEAVRPQALRALTRAGKQAAANFENDGAVDYFSRALALTLEKDVETRYTLLLGREAVYHLQGAREAQAGDLEALEALVQPRQCPEELAEVALRQAKLGEATGEYPAAIVAAQTAIAAAREAGEVGLEAAGQAEWGRALWKQGEYPAAGEHLTQARTLAQAGGRRDLEAEALRLLGNVAGNQGEYSRAREFYEQSLAITREIGDRAREGMALLNLGTVAGEQGEYPRAREFFEQSLAIAREIGDREGVDVALSNLGCVACDQGNYAEARVFYEQSLAIAREIGNRAGEGRALGSLGSVAFNQGDYAEARKFYEQSLAIAREIGNRAGEGRALERLGSVARDQGDYTGGQKFYEQSLAIAREIGNRAGEGTALGSLGSVACDQGDYAGGRKFYEQSLVIACEIGERRTEGSALTGLGEALTSLGDLDEAAATLQQAIALRRDLGHQECLMESLAALAQVFLAQGEPVQALTHIEEILASLSENDSLDAEYSLRIYLTCYQVLSVNRDSRATEILQTAHDRLQERAARFPDEETRHRFLNNIPWHREILAAYRGEAVPPPPATVPVHAVPEPQPEPEAPTNTELAESPSTATAPSTILEETRTAPLTAPPVAEETKSVSEQAKDDPSQRTTRKKKKKKKKKKKRKKTKQQQTPITISITIEQLTIIFRQDDF